MSQVTRRIAQVVGGLFLVLGVFWTGRESAHGLGAFWEHWWCPIPLVLILLGIAALITTARRASPSA
jgi:hypothetical protein